MEEYKMHIKKCKKPTEKAKHWLISTIWNFGKDETVEIIKKDQWLLVVGKGEDE